MSIPITRPAANPVVQYGIRFEGQYDLLEIEMHMIRKSGKWNDPKSKKSLGNGLEFHYEQMRKLLWPYMDEHRWHCLCRDEILKNKVTVLMGPGSSGKTNASAWIYLCEYFCFPNETLLMVSSTGMRELRMRIWGEISSLWQQAKDRYPYLAGYLLDSRVAITTDKLEDKVVDEERRVRDMRKGIVGIPTVQGTKQVGLGRWIGVKQKRLRLVADEASLMGESFLSAFSNLNKNEDFRAIIAGNPMDITDPLGMAAEPIDGWGAAQMEPTKTSVWRTKFMNGTCVNLIGTDSPNFDQRGPARYKYLISREKIADTLSFFPKDSPEYYSQCVGSMKISMMARRVITRTLCHQNDALGVAKWMGTDRIRVASLDAAYGGDRCVIGWGEFGLDVEGRQLICVYEPVTVPIIVGNKEPEEQIALFTKNFCQNHAVEPENFFHDSTGRGSLGTALARVWSAACNPVEFGGKPTTRPVSMDHFITDDETGERRLKLSFEHYYNFVTELWYATRYTIEAGQMRGLRESVMDEGCKRQWDWVARGGYKVIQVEPKEEMKLRTRRSPDEFDQLVILVEGARRRGFQISKMARTVAEESKEDWIDKTAREQEDVLTGALLQHS